MDASRWIWIAAALFALAGCADGGAGEAPPPSDFAAPPDFAAGEDADSFPEPSFIAGGDAAAAPAATAGPIAGDPNLSALMGGGGAPGAGLADSGRAPTFVAAQPAPTPTPAAAADAGTMNAWLDDVAPETSSPGDTAAASAGGPVGGFGVQIASYKKRAAAEKGWSLFAKRYGGLLDAYQRRIVEADIPGRGRFYRLVAVGGERPKLAGLCDQIQARGGSCLLRRL